MAVPESIRLVVQILERYSLLIQSFTMIILVAVTIYYAIQSYLMVQ